MLIASEGYTEALALAERDGSVPLWVHTHPRGCLVMTAVIPAKAGIQKREQSFVTLHNTSWVRDYHEIWTSGIQISG